MCALCDVTKEPSRHKLQVTHCIANSANMIRAANSNFDVHRAPPAVRRTLCNLLSSRMKMKELKITQSVFLDLTIRKPSFPNFRRQPT